MLRHRHCGGVAVTVIISPPGFYDRTPVFPHMQELLTTKPVHRLPVRTRQEGELQNYR